jgi:hypothetical protein
LLVEYVERQRETSKLLNAIEGMNSTTHQEFTGDKAIDNSPQVIQIDRHLSNKAKDLLDAVNQQIETEITELKAIGQPIYYSRNGKLIREDADSKKYEYAPLPDGGEEIIGEISDNDNIFLSSYSPSKVVMKSKNVLRIVVASPSDVQTERDILGDKVIPELNRGIANTHNITLELCRWETDSYPGFHLDGPQGLIDGILKIDECDILIGIFWKRFGTPIQDGTTGTEHEIMTAYESWKSKRTPKIMMYFKQKEFMPNSSDLKQMEGVLNFKKNIPKEGLYWSFKEEEFESLLRQHLTRVIEIIVKEEQEVSPQIKNRTETTQTPDLKITLTNSSEISKHLQVDDVNSIVDIIADLAYNSTEDSSVIFKNWMERADIPRNWIQSFACSRDVRIASRELVNHLYGRGLNINNPNFNTLGSLLKVLLDEIGLDKASIVMSVIVKYNMIRDRELLKKLKARYFS